MSGHIYGNPVPITEMSDGHLVKAIRMLELQHEAEKDAASIADDSSLCPFIPEPPELEALRDEAVKRGLLKEEDDSASKIDWQISHDPETLLEYHGDSVTVLIMSKEGARCISIAVDGLNDDDANLRLAARLVRSVEQTLANEIRHQKRKEA